MHKAGRHAGRLGNVCAKGQGRQADAMPWDPCHCLACVSVLMQSGGTEEMGAQAGGQVLVEGLAWMACRHLRRGRPGTASTYTGRLWRAGTGGGGAGGAREPAPGACRPLGCSAAASPLLCASSLHSICLEAGVCQVLGARGQRCRVYCPRGGGRSSRLQHMPSLAPQTSAGDLGWRWRSRAPLRPPLTLCQIDVQRRAAQLDGLRLRRAARPARPARRSRAVGQECGASCSPLR